MKRAGRLIEKIADIDNLALAARKAFRGKQGAESVISFRSELSDNLYILRKEILSGNIETGDYHQFTIFEPKERKICAAPFKQRVLHHAIMNICHDFFDRNLIYDSYASRLGKGSHKAILRVQNKMINFKFFVKLDIKKYFDSIHHKKLKSILSKIFKDERLLCLFDKIIDSYGLDRSLPIGNLTSQYFANVYLSSLDHYMKEKVNCPVYVRYMDDVIILAKEKKQLNNYISEYVNFAEKELLLTVKPPIIGRICQGVPFLGFRVFRDKILMNGKGKRRFIKKLNILNSLYIDSKICEKQFSDRLNSLLAPAYFAQSYNFRKKIFG